MKTKPAIMSVLGLSLLFASSTKAQTPPVDARQQRPWLQAHLISDMQNLGSFDGERVARVSSLVKTATNDEIALLCQYYLLTRSKAEQDAYIFALQQQHSAPEQLVAAKAAMADLSTEMQDQGNACYDQLQTLGEPAQDIAQMEYASVPGWCVSAQCCVPDAFFDNGTYVGPFGNAAYCGNYSGSIHQAYYNHDSHFYKAYHRFAMDYYWRHSAQLAIRSAKYFREHDFHRMLAHDHLLGKSSVLRQAAPHDAHTVQAAGQGKFVAKPKPKPKQERVPHSPKNQSNAKETKETKETHATHHEKSAGSKKQNPVQKVAKAGKPAGSKAHKPAHQPKPKAKASKAKHK